MCSSFLSKVSRRFVKVNAFSFKIQKKKKKDFDQEKKSAMLLSLERDTFLLVRKRSDEPTHRDDGRRVREYTPFAVVAFVRRGVVEWRRVSRYRGEACDV
jgi:hypothetical protein